MTAHSDMRLLPLVTVAFPWTDRDDPTFTESMTKERPWIVNLGFLPARTFSRLENAIGYATTEVAHRPIGTHAVLTHRRTGPYMTIDRLPARKVVVTLQFLGER